MHILFLSDNFPPEVNAPATRTYEHCREWVKMGAHVTVITCVPNYPQGKIYPGYKNRFFQEEEIEGIKVIRVWSFIARNEGFMKRIIDYVSFAATSFLIGLFQKTDVIIATSPQFFTTLSGYGLSIFKRRPWVFELRDLWPDTIRSLAAVKNDMLLNYLEKLELFLYRKSTMVIPLTDAFKRNLISRGIQGDKINVVTNGSNLSLFEPRPKDEELLNKYGLKGKFIIGYVGTHGMAHNLECLVRIFDRVNDEEIIFLFIGDGACKEEIVRIKEDKNLDNMLMLDPVSKSEIARYWSIIDAALVPLRKAPTFKTVIPSKIFEAAAMKKPILLGVEGQAKEIIEKYNCGLCFEPENQRDFIEKVIELKSQKELYRRLSTNCALLAADFDRKDLIIKMYKYLESLATKKER